jgi:NAD(P)-dependent dehydrogenase (short-subunit alcohol dehydrogenase family)
VCWGGVYHCSRAFLPLLIASDEGCIINTSSVNGFWASIGPSFAHTAYSSAKFAVKGFTEALITDLRLNAPHVKAVLVMPGHIGTSIILNSSKVLGRPDAPTDADLDRMREMMSRRGMPPDALTDDQLRQAMEQMAIMFRDNAPVSAAQAATTILDGVRSDSWRVLVGEDAKVLDRMVRETPELAYEQQFAKALNDSGHMRLLE